MDDDVEEVGAMLPVEVLMKSSFPRRRRQGDCCSCCCFYRLLRHRHRHRYSCCYDRCRDEGRYDKGFLDDCSRLSPGNLLVSGELVESAFKLIADGLVLLLLLDQVRFKFITFLLEFASLSLALSGTGLGVLESGAEIANGLLV